MRSKLWYICSGDLGGSFRLGVCTDDTKTFQKGGGVISSLGSVCGKERVTVTRR